MTRRRGLSLWLLLLGSLSLAWVTGSKFWEGVATGALVVPASESRAAYAISRLTDPVLFVVDMGVLGLLTLLFAAGSAFALTALTGRASPRVEAAVDRAFPLWDARSPTRWHPVWLVVLVVLVAGIVYVAV